MAAVTVTAGFCAAKAHHAVFARGEVGRAGFVRGDGGLAGDVAVGRVFGERRFDGDADDV